MFSRILIGLSFILTLNIACTPKVGEEPPAQQIQDVGGTECLTTSAASVRKFFDGEATNLEMDLAWDCIGVAFYKFQQYVRGSTPGVYTPRELATFLEDNFFEKNESGQPKSRIPDSLLVQFMYLKQIFVGGSETIVTREEVLRSIEVFKELKKATALINPHMKVLLMSWEAPEDGLRDGSLGIFEKANEDTQTAARIIADIIRDSGSSYELDNLPIFIEELAQFYNEKWSAAERVRQYLPVFKKLKVALAGGTESGVQNREWRTIVLLGARGWMQYLRYWYFIQKPAQAGKGIKLAYLARSFEDGFSIFEDLVREKPGGFISKAEVQEIFFKLSGVWPEFKTSEKLVYEFMKVKVLFIGGSVDSFTNADFQNARLKVKQFRFILEKFLPYVGVYGGEWDYSDMTADDAKDYFFEAQYSLESAAKELGGLLEGNYDLNDFKGLVTEWDLLYPPVKPEESFGFWIVTYLPTVQSVKNAIYDSNDSLIRKAQWANFLGLVSRGYMDGLFLKYFIQNRNLNDRIVLENVKVFIEQSTSILRDVLAVKSSSIISQERINQIVQELRLIKVIPQEIQVDSLEGLVRVILNYILNPPESRLAGELPFALNFVSVERLRSELLSWVEVELFFSRAVQSSGSTTDLSPSELTKAIKAELSSNPAPLLKQALTELDLVISEKSPMDIDSRGHLKITNLNPHTYSRESLRAVNTSRMISRILIQSFAGDLKRIQDFSGITEPEAQVAFNLVKGVFVDLGMLDPINDRFIPNRFLESNLFTPHSNGNSLGSFGELTYLVHLIFSGKVNDSDLMPGLLATCLPNNKNPQLNDRVSYLCLRKHYRTALIKNLPGLPGMVQYLKDQNEKTFQAFFYNTLRASGWEPDSGNEAKMTVKLSDVGLYPHLLQYMEMLVSMYDSDHDSAIGTDEALKAFPNFLELFKVVAAKELKDGTLKESELPALFTYMLKYGKAPEGIWEGLTRFKPWVAAGPSGWVVWANRTKLASVLGYISEQVSKARLQPIN